MPQGTECLQVLLSSATWRIRARYVVPDTTVCSALFSLSPRHKVGALRDDAVCLSICLLVYLFPEILRPRNGRHYQCFLHSCSVRIKRIKYAWEKIRVL